MPRGLAGVSLAGAHGHGQFDSDSQGLTKLTRPRVEMCEDKFMAFVERLANPTGQLRWSTAIHATADKLSPYEDARHVYSTSSNRYQRLGLGNRGGVSASFLWRWSYANASSKDAKRSVGPKAKFCARHRRTCDALYKRANRDGWRFADEDGHQYIAIGCGPVR